MLTETRAGLTLDPPAELTVTAGGDTGNSPSLVEVRPSVLAPTDEAEGRLVLLEGEYRLAGRRVLFPAGIILYPVKNKDKNIQIQVDDYTRKVQLSNSKLVDYNTKSPSRLSLKKHRSDCSLAVTGACIWLLFIRHKYG